SLTRRGITGNSADDPSPALSLTAHDFARPPFALASPNSNPQKPSPRVGPSPRLLGIGAAEANELRPRPFPPAAVFNLYRNALERRFPVGGPADDKHRARLRNHESVDAAGPEILRRQADGLPRLQGLFPLRLVCR